MRLEQPPITFVHPTTLHPLTAAGQAVLRNPQSIDREIG